MSARFHIVKEFGFEAAHHFPHKPDGHENTRMHGHSFKVEVELAGEPDAVTGCVVDFEDVARAIVAVREQLDHHLLNTVPGLEKPSLEHIARWIAEKLQTKFPQLVSITVRRPSCGEACRYAVGA
ncbi:MAG: 6-carboxytetrahydropterin synthase [Rhodospirillaceae bacterium]|nr:6-carboxytetrahydropterin synthase [Rhodospirillaceae bacterium]